MTLSSAEPAIGTPPQASEPRDRSDLRTSLLVALCCLLVYNANFRAIPAGDTYPARYLPFAILHYHTLLLDPVASLAAQGRGDTAYWILHLRGGHLMSLYPVIVPLVIAPLYVPAVVFLDLHDWTDVRVDYVARVMEKISASLIAALSAALLHLLLRRRTSALHALLLTFAFAFGTTTWVICSQALWQHGMAQLLIIGTLLLLTSPCTTARTVAVGLLCGLIPCNRPPDLILAAAMGAYALLWAAGRRAWLLAASVTPPMLLVLTYNLPYGGNIAGGYGKAGHASFFDHDLLSGIAGLMVSPARGLLVFSPFLLFVALAWRRLPRNRDERHLSLALGAGVILQILLYAKIDWRGGMSWGPRYMTDLLPFLIWLLVPVVAALRRAGRIFFLLCVAIAVTFEAVGAFAYSGWVDAVMLTNGPDAMREAWKWRRAPFLQSLKEGVAPRDLMIEPRGHLDAIESGGRVVSTVTAGRQVTVSGWALAGDRSPWQVAVIIDGRESVVTDSFADRADVRAKLHASGAAGWRIAIDTSGMAPGEHRLAAMVWTARGSDPYFLDERPLMVGAPSTENAPGKLPRDGGPPTSDDSLKEAAARAAGRIRADQQPEGYWLTQFTSGTRFRDPHPEMNTFLTSLLVDLLDPVASQHAIEGCLRRARRHLTAQIEPGGLVRYHGLPNAPGIGTLGCVITPDTDDTALVWRIAPGRDRNELVAAMNTLDRYRTRSGLYRSWLAPREAYQCLDPGRDPNPADIVIQMHVLLLLSEVRPAAAHALCEALRPVADDDRVWVYYRRTPLLPVLRLPELHRAGCDLVLPESRLRTDVPGQQIWVSVARMLASPVNSLVSIADRARMRTILAELADRDFARIRTEPPFLYHNDLTATVSRSYWSEDVGYALWLRLYDRYQHLPDTKPANQTPRPPLSLVPPPGGHPGLAGTAADRGRFRSRPSASAPPGAAGDALPRQHLSDRPRLPSE